MTTGGKIRWGFLSTAAIGADAYVPAIRASRNGILHAVASRRPDQARDFAAQHGFVRAHDSYEALLADPEVDAIYNPLPNALHAEWSMRAADAGKPVLCEKPLAVNAAEARAVVDYFHQRGVLLAEGFMYRHHPLTRTALELLRSGRIGTLRAVRASFFAVEGKPETDIRFSPELGGGALADLGCYCVNIIRQAAGEEPMEVRAVMDPLPSGVDGRTAGVMKFPSGVVAELACGLLMPFSCAYEFLGSEGRILVDEGGMVAWPGTAFAIKLWTRAGGAEVITVPPANHYQLMAELFAGALLGEKPLEIPAEDAVRNLEVMDRIRASAAVLV
jgi:predicted dehydrogenase